MTEKKITPGVVNLGYEYEKCVSAYLCLKLLEDDSIKNFVLNINPSSYRKFDDLTISIIYHGGQTEQFALQLKHRQVGRDKINARSELNREKKSFEISKYCAEFEKLSPDVQNNYKFILFTNTTFQNFHEVRNYDAKLCKTSFKANVFNTDNIYQFQESKTNRQKEFYRRFYLFSAQKNVHELTEAIVQIFLERFHSDSNSTTCYIDFFANLRMGNYEDTKITKDEVILKLTSLLLSTHVIRTPLRKERDEKIQQLEEAVQKFDVTLLEDIDKDFIKNNWCYPNRQANSVEKWARENKLLQSKNQDMLLVDEQQRELLCYLMENMLFLAITENCAKLIYQIINLCKSAENVKLKFVLVGERITNKNLEQWKIFGNLSDLKSNQEFYNKVTTSFKISLQGRKAETLETLKRKFNLDLDDFITPNELFRMLQDDFLVGQAFEKITGYYIPRILLKEEFSYKYLPQVCEQKTVIVQCNGKSKTFKETLKSEFRNLKFLDFNNFQRNPRDYTKSFVILTDEKSNLQLNFIFHIKLTENNKLAWIDNKLKAEELLTLDKQVNVVCGTPGIGKSTMMKSLANECPLNYWVIIVPLKQHSWFFKKPSSTAKVLKHLFGNNNKIDEAILQYFNKNRQILFLFDGLDELDSNSISNVINTMKQLKGEGYKIWIFCTKYLEKTLRRELQIYSIYKIEDLKKEDLKKYVYQHLQEKGVSAEKVAKITHNMFENNIEEMEKDILKVPLFLFIASEIISESENFDNWEDILTVTHMFSRFIERRFRHNLEKVGYNHQAGLEVIIEGFKNYYFKEYKFAALKSCLDPNLLKNVQLKNDKKFVKQINEHGDFLGLILKIDKDETFVFCHHSFAEYFAALWLSENYEELPHNERRFVFDEKYYRIRYFFNVILAEGCPLHQAVLRQDISEVEKLIPTHWNKTDHGGRTPLHLASSFGQKYPILRDVDLSSNQCENSTTHQKILQCILRAESIDPLQKDTIFGWNCFEYADASLSLRSLEQLSAYSYNKLEPDYLRNYEDLKNLCQYCVSLGFVKLLTNVINLKGLSNLDNCDKPLTNLASECGQIEVVKFLIKNDVDLSRTCPDGRTALHEAALWGHSDLIKSLLNAKLDLNKKDSKENTPLQLAVKMGHFNIVKILIEGGADVNTTDEEGRTPLHKASYRANTDIVEYLVEHGADVDRQDINQESSLQHAVQMGHFVVVKFLVERKANIQAADKSRRTALHWAAYEGSQLMVRYLVLKGINVVAMDDDGKTALQIAKEKQHKNIVNFLQNVALRTPSETIEESRLDKLAQIFDLKKLQQKFEYVDVNSTNAYNDTLLHVACYYGNEDLVKYLLDQGANTNAQNNDGRIPLHLASQRGHVNVMKLLLKRDRTKIEDKWGLTPLHRAAYKGHKDAVQVLLEAGFDPNSPNNHHSTPLHSAARGGHNDVIDLLIEKNANVKAVNVYKRTCLHEAATHGFTDTVRHLVKLCKHIVDAVDNEGRTALHLSAEKNYFTIVQTLVQAKASISLIDNYRKSALNIASENNCKEIVEYLQKH